MITPKMQIRPNIVFIMADQLAAAALGCYGFPVQATPNLDRLAQHGVRYDRHYAIHPVCGPARATIFTGRSSSATRVFYNNCSMNPALPHFPQLLQRSGYRTGGFGKFHFHDMQEPLIEDMSPFGYDVAGPTEDPKTGPWLRWVQEQYPEHYEAALSLVWPRDYFTREQRQQWQAAFNKHVRPCMTASNCTQLVYESPLPAKCHQTRWITDQGLNFIEQSAQNDEQPFYCYLSYVAPHNPYDPPPEYAALFNPNDMPDPLPAEWQNANAPPAYRNSTGPARIADLEKRKLCDYSLEDWRQLRAHYFATVKFIDDEIGRLLEKLKQAGLDKDTIVVFTTDHGDMIGDHSLLTKGFKHYDKSIRCPLIVYDPRCTQSGATVDRMTTILDLFPTFCELADIDCNDLPLEGQSIFRTGRRDNVLIQINPENTGQSLRTIVTDDGWRLSLFPGTNYGELFNLTEDPDEQHNHYGNSSHTHIENQLMRQLVDQWDCYQRQAYN